MPIFTDYKECKKYEGKAVLVEKIRDGDSFYLADEQVTVPEKKSYSEYEKEKLKKYSRLHYFFYGKSSPPDKELVKLRKALTKERKDQLDDYVRMDQVIEKYREKYSDTPRKITTVLNEFDNDYIIRFIQQDRNKWSPSIYNYERWLVHFIEDQHGWSCDFKTQRNIRILTIVNPNESIRSSDIRRFTTYNYGTPSMATRTEDEEDFGEFIDDEDFDQLIIKKLDEYGNHDD